MKKNRLFAAFYRQYIKGAGGRIFLLLCIILLGVGIGNISPYLYGRLLDFISAGQLKALVFVIFFYFVCQIGENVLASLEDYYGSKTSFLLVKNRKAVLFRKILHMRCRELDHTETGELFTRLESDIESVIDFFLNTVTAVFSILFTLLVTLMFIFRISPFLALIAVAFVPVSVVVNQMFKKPFKAVSLSQKKYSDRYYTLLSGILTNIAGLRAFRLEKKREGDFKRYQEESWSIQRRSKMLGYLSGLLQMTVTSISTLLLMYVSALLILKGEFTLGSMVAFLTYMSRLTQAVKEALSLNLEAQGVLVCMERLVSLESAEDELSLYKPALKGGVPFTKLEMEQICFQYEEEEVLRGLTLVINGPGLYTVVGKNGCGKSTLLKLAVRNYETASGRIFLNGRNIRDYNLEEIRTRILYLPKTPYYVDGTVLENLLLICPGLSEDAVGKTLAEYGMEAFETAFPGGLTARVGPDGALLSGGQRQKLNLARAVLACPDILLLDEGTSDLDGKAELEFLAVLRKIAEKAIVIQVAHRARAVMESDRIFLMEYGRVIAEGRHEELMNGSEPYREMFGHLRDMVF